MNMQEDLELMRDIITTQSALNYLDYVNVAGKSMEELAELRLRKKTNS